jgi:hypothetical protein
VVVQGSINAYLSNLNKKKVNTIISVKQLSPPRIFTFALLSLVFYIAYMTFYLLDFSKRKKYKLLPLSTYFFKKNIHLYKNYGAPLFIITVKQVALFSR